MNSREKILKSVAANKPATSPHPEILTFPENDGGQQSGKFIEVLKSIGGRAFRADDMETVKKDLDSSLLKGEHVVNIVQEIGILNQEINASSDAVSLSAVDRVFMKSNLGVSENGSVWLTEEDMICRLLPFICQHLVIVLAAKNIVPDMHEAYKKVKGYTGGYAIFVAGPSKTADIEQSLVIGAHGPRSLTVYLIG